MHFEDTAGVKNGKERTKARIKNVLKKIQRGNEAAIEELLDTDPDFYWKDLYFDKTDDSILHCASRLGLLSAIEHLTTVIGVDFKNKDDKTALHEAAQNSQYKACETLLQYGADVNALKRADWTPLMLACTKTGEDSLKTVEILLKHNALLDCKNKDGWTAFHMVCRSGDVAICKTLLKHNVNPYQTTKNGRTPLHIAALHGNIQIVQILLEKNLDVNARDLCGNTALHEAVSGDSVEVCKLLVDSGSDVNSLNNRGLGLVHLAACGGHLDVLELVLVDLGLDVNGKSVDGITAIQCAQKNCHKEAFEYLVRNGAKTDTNEDISSKN